MESMKLTGKCKEDFDKWLNLPALTGDVHHFKVIIGVNKFKDLTDSMKYGVYVDFFDLKGIYISTGGLVLSKTYISELSIKENIEFSFDGFKTRQEARIAAIEKANELYNNIK